jgi:hypothetical protein
MQEQGYDMDPSLLYQDNMSAILLETNDRASSSRRNKRINVQYYLIKDKVNQKEKTIEHCPTKQMWTDINTKPKQGTVFCVFRGHVMGITADYNDASFATRCNFRPPDWIPEPEPVSMLPIPKDWIAPQECVGVRTKPAAARPTAKVRFAVDVEEVQAPIKMVSGQDRRAPIKMVSGRAWSPGIYRALRLLGMMLDVAWERAFIHTLTSN